MKQKRYTLMLAAVAAVLMVVSGSVVLAEDQPAAQLSAHPSDDTGGEKPIGDEAVNLQQQREAGTRIINAPMCFLPRFTENEQDRCSLVGWIVRKVFSVELDD